MDIKSENEYSQQASVDSRLFVGSHLQEGEMTKVSTRRIMIKVAYDGTNYSGWQIQINALTIEEVLNKALSDLLNEGITVTGASRTDAGVHALCNFAIFDTLTKMPADKICYAVNTRLPEDIRVTQSVEVDKEFHPRRCLTKKTYEYHILNTKIASPIKRNFAHFCHYNCDVELMKIAAKDFKGKHDFKAFCTVGTQVLTTVREITDISVNRVGDEIVIRVTGYGFLYNMVRIIAGTLLEIGCGRRAVDSIPATIESLDRTKAGPTAPARGLMLVEYEFVDEEK